jgi:hypothetical protein
MCQNAKQSKWWSNLDGVSTKVWLATLPASRACRGCRLQWVESNSVAFRYYSHPHQWSCIYVTCLSRQGLHVEMATAQRGSKLELATFRDFLSWLTWPQPETISSSALLPAWWFHHLSTMYIHTGRRRGLFLDWVSFDEYTQSQDTQFDRPPARLN